MKISHLNKTLGFIFILFFASCSENETIIDTPNQSFENTESFSSIIDTDNLTEVFGLLEQIAGAENLNPDILSALISDDHHNQNIDLLNGVEPSECSNENPLGDEYLSNSVIFEQNLENGVLNLLESGYTEEEVSQLIAALSLHLTYLQNPAFYLINPYTEFGSSQQTTAFVNRDVKDLERFWGYENEILVFGNNYKGVFLDTDYLIEFYTILFSTVTDDPEQQVALAEFIVNSIQEIESEFFPGLFDNPIVYFTGYAATTQDLSFSWIELGDGIPVILNEIGVELDVAYAGILSHEWAHQVYFRNISDWYPNGISDDQATATREIELLADYFAGYYLTHKKGGTYNWNKVQEFIELFGHIGDCGFDNPGHHGTPIQRERAAYQGYLLANTGQKKGKILTDDEVFEQFKAELENIIG